MRGDQDVNFWSDEAARIANEQSYRKAMGRVAFGGPQTLSPMNGPITVQDGAVLTPAQGIKFDSGKLRHDLVPTEAINALAHVLTDGAAKYGDRNWEKGMDWSRLYAAAQRHLLAFWEGEDRDPESAHPHLWHALTNIAFLIAYQKRGIGEDTRP